jgi:thiol-disulfide isomerase/thioredoxin
MEEAPMTKRNDMPNHFDIRRELWKSSFEAAASYSAYLDASPREKARRWEDMAAKIPELTEDEKARLRGHGRILNVLLVSGVWCGDCVRQGPMIDRIARAAGDNVRLRVLDRDVDARLRDELRILGGMRVPVAVFLSEDFFEVGRFGDRMLATYRKKAATEQGPACPVPYALPPENEILAAEQSEWVDVFERMLLMLRLDPSLRERHPDLPRE